jgi:hypothetical protein
MIVKPRPQRSRVVSRSSQGCVVSLESPPEQYRHDEASARNNDHFEPPFSDGFDHHNRDTECRRAVASPVGAITPQ